MYYIVQEDLFKEFHHKTLIQTLERFKFDYEIVKFRPFIHEIEFKTNRKNVFCFGAVKMAHVANKYDWQPGSFMNENHNYEVYAKEFGFENMLNGDGEVINFGDEIKLDSYIFFIRPVEDNKAFTGQIFTKDSYTEYVNEYLKDENYPLLKPSTRILVAPIKEIQQEVRCWIVKGKVITASRYKLGNFVSYKNYDDETFYIDFAQKMVDKYQPADAFVLDICLVNDELKIVEVNCINCAGFYDLNIQKLLLTLEEQFNIK